MAAPWVFGRYWVLSPLDRKIPHQFIVTGPYIATGVQDIEPLSEEKRQDAASTLVSVNRRRPGVKNHSIKSPKAATLGLLWVI
jgi:hypothetical protein